MIGILGGGQLGRMLALASHNLGITCRVFDPEPDATAGRVAQHLAGRYEDFNALDVFARGLEVVTFEFENVPVDAAEHLARSSSVFPPPSALHVAQDRFREKSLFREIGIDTPRFEPVDSHESLCAATESLGFPAVLKTRRGGYDGKGQCIIRSTDQIADSWNELGRTNLILEEFVPFDRELSIVAVRDRVGRTQFYPLVENLHQGGILRRTIAPAPALTPDVAETAQAWARRLLERLEYVGVLAIELFEVSGRLLANEFAPRVHNSGHWSMDGAETSQFENHLRAILGLPLGATDIIAPTTMVNLIGSVPPAHEVLAIPGAHLHDYDKEPRAGRKVGHINIRQRPSVDFADAVRRAEELASAALLP